MITSVWSKYQPPAEPVPEDPEQPASWPVLGGSAGDGPPPRPPRPSATSGPVVAAVAILAPLIGGVALVGVLASNTTEAASEESAWEECIASQADDEPGLLTPADLCEIGHERPPGYRDYDDYDWEPGQDYDSWSEWEHEQ